MLHLDVSGIQFETTQECIYIARRTHTENEKGGLLKKGKDIKQKWQSKHITTGLKQHIDISKRDPPPLQVIVHMLVGNIKAATEGAMLAAPTMGVASGDPHLGNVTQSTQVGRRKRKQK